MSCAGAKGAGKQAAVSPWFLVIQRDFPWFCQQTGSKLVAEWQHVEQVDCGAFRL